MYKKKHLLTTGYTAGKEVMVFRDLLSGFAEDKLGLKETSHEL